MNKYITCIYIVIAILLLNTKPTLAQNLEAEVSATLKNQAIGEVNYDYRVERLANFLESYNSPLAGYARYFVMYADQYGMDYRMVPAISGVESTFGKRIPAKSFNAYGWANGKYRFKSWPHSIDIVTGTLRSKYVDRGATSISSIAKRYAPPSKTWGPKVRFFMQKIDVLPANFDIIS